MHFWHSAGHEPMQEDGRESSGGASGQASSILGVSWRGAPVDDKIEQNH